MDAPPRLVSFPDDGTIVEILAEELRLSIEERQLSTELYQRGLPPLVKTSCLPYLFGISPKLIGAMMRSPERYYRVFSVRKASGGERQIEAPRRFLKVIQKWIYEHVLSGIQFPTYVAGFARGRSVFDHAAIHIDGRNLLIIDIQDFFPSINYESVKQAYLDIGFPDAVGRQLGRLSTFRERLPQGAPTSPALANLVFRPVDEQLIALASDWGCSYSRYADDLAFSGDRRFTKDDVDRLGRILEENNFNLNERKSRILGAGARQLITGLVTNDKPHPPREVRRKWRAMFNRAERHPQEYVDRQPVLNGIAAFIKQYDPSLSATYFEIARRVQRSALG